MKQVALLFALVSLTMVSAQDAFAQTAELPPVHATWLKLTGDSIRLEYSVPSASGAWPTVIVLPDRFGIGESVRGATVVAITPHTVTLAMRGQTKVLQVERELLRRAARAR